MKITTLQRQGTNWMNNYFSIERKGKCVDRVLIKDKDGKIVFENVLAMSYDEILTYDRLEEFVVIVMDTANIYFSEKDEQTLITLIGEDDIFIWSILIGVNDDGELLYKLVSWKKDGKLYRYEKI